MGQQVSCRENDNDISAEGNDQGRSAFSESLQRTGGCDGNCRNQKARADACQCLSAKTDGLRIAAEQSDQLFRNGKADACSNKHDHRTHNQGDLINLPHTLMLACTVVEADDRTHALYNAVCCQIDERLQLVVNAEHDNVALGIHGQDSIQCGNQKRRQRQVQDRRDADRVQSSDQIFSFF